jgi:hypothetical protein
VFVNTKISQQNKTQIHFREVLEKEDHKPKMTSSNVNKTSCISDASSSSSSYFTAEEDSPLTSGRSSSHTTSLSTMLMGELECPICLTMMVGSSTSHSSTPMVILAALLAPPECPPAHHVAPQEHGADASPWRELAPGFLIGRW